MSGNTVPPVGNWMLAVMDSMNNASGALATSQETWANLTQLDASTEQQVYANYCLILQNDSAAVQADPTNQALTNQYSQDQAVAQAAETQASGWLQGAQGETGQVGTDTQNLLGAVGPILAINQAVASAIQST